MSKKIVLMGLLLLLVLVAISGCSSGIIEVGVEPAIEKPSEAKLLPEESALGDNAIPEEAVEPAPADGPAQDASIAEADAPVDGIVYNDDGSSTYTNTEYGFRFTYPAGWSLAETPYEEMPEESGFDRGPSIQLTKDEILLFIGYRHAGDNAIWWTGVGAFGPEMSRETIGFLGQDIIQMAHGYDGKVKFVGYEAASGGQISADGLEFGIRMDDMQQALVDDLEIPSDILTEADAILTSFELLP